MSAAFEHLVYVYSYRVASDGGPTAEILYPKLYRHRNEAWYAALDCPNWNTQQVVEVTVRCYHPEDDGGQGMPSSMWRPKVIKLFNPWFLIPPEPLTELADPAVREKLAKTIKR